MRIGRLMYHDRMDICAFLSGNGIPYERFEHPAVFTCEESGKLAPKMPGADTKNLFLRDGKSVRHLIITVRHRKTVDLKKLRDMLGVKGLTFGSQEKLRELLGVDPGSVTLLGLINDASRAVEVWIDREVWAQDRIQCHPLTNTATLVIPREGMEKVFRLTGHKVNVIDVPAKEIGAVS